jgi:hypothetical protein
MKKGALALLCREPAKKLVLRAPEENSVRFLPDSHRLGESEENREFI